MKKTFLLQVLIGLSIISIGQSDTIKHRIFLVGDAGWIYNNAHPVIDWLKKNVDWDDERNTLMYLGDNIYEAGLPPKGDPTYDFSEQILKYQLSLVKDKKARAYFIPGNHDWKNGKIGGVEQVKNQVNYIRNLEWKNVEIWPGDGCPGPIEVELSDSVVLVMFDSQWWLHTHEKPGLESHCDTKTEDEVISVFEEIAEMNKNRLMIVAMHHPLYSYGIHGGNYTLRHHLFPFTEINSSLYIPLPILGSIYPVARGVFGNIQDVKHPVYRTLIREVERVMKKHPNAIHVSGHDHVLQFIVKDNLPFIVSGSGAKISRVKTGRNLEFRAAELGFTTIEVYTNGKVFTKFYTASSVASPASKNLEDPKFTKELKTIVQPEKEEQYTRVIALPDSVVVAANPKLKGNSIRNLLLGKNYRQEWIQPIKVRVLDIVTEWGGLTPTRRGGGKQTKVLRLEDSTGREFSLRSIKKFPAPAMPAEFRETFVRDLVEDGISASYPYASLSMGPLTRAAGLPFLRNQLVYVADDTSLGRFREDFANTLCMLEEREPIYIPKTYNTDELLVRLWKDNDDHVNQKSVLMSRTLDMFIMDFDRHEDQWRWFTTDTGRGKIYNPIARDRDQAFFVNQGIIPGILKKRQFIPDIQGFRPKAYNIKTFNKSARNFDRSFLNELDEYQWSYMIDSFLTLMKDEVLVQSLQLQPPEIRGFSADDILNKLRERRKYLKSDMLEYYRFISKIVSVTGSNQQELFTINRNSDGSVQVTVNKIDKEGAISSKIYDRLFVPEVTKELRIYGLAGNDKFVFSGGTNDIKIRIIGGDGNDEFNSTGTSSRTLVYDASFEENIFTGNKNYKSKVSNDPSVNVYDRLSYRYNIFNPGTYFAYNLDDGFYLGLEFFLVTHGFRKDPFKMQHNLSVAHALSSKTYAFNYRGEYIKLIRHHDLLVKADIRAPINVKNFFGIGNATEFDKTKGEKAYYYRARYNMGDISIMGRRNLQSWMNVSYGLAFQFFSMDSSRNIGKFITESFNNGYVDFTRKYFAGPSISLDIDNRNNKVLPSRGTKMNMGGRTLIGLNQDSRTVTQLNFDLSIFISLIEESNVVLATRFGIGHNIGKYEFFQAQYLGGNENLRGYHNYRFAGRTRYFNNTELRFRLVQFRTYFFPGSMGMLVFHDVGKVSVPSQAKGKWHTGYGAGVWISPLRRVVIAGTYMRSIEGGLPLVSFGFQF